MMIRLIFCLSCMLMFSGCLSFFSDNASTVQQSDENARRILRKAYYEMEQAHYYYAREIVKPLLNHPTVGREARLLDRQIEFLINYRNIKREQELSSRIAINDVEKRLVLPEKYNQVKKFLPKVGPFVLEPGPMEKLLDQPVTIQVENADLPALLEALSKVEGINFIADDGLTVERNLTIKVKDVPLRDILAYIERNMGLNFIVTKNIIWITKGQASEEVSPKLETKIIYLKKGYIPGKVTSAKSGAQGGRGGRGGRGAQGQVGANPQGQGGSNAGEDELMDALTAFLTDPTLDRPEGASFQIFRNRNILLIRDTRENIRFVQELIDAFDRDYLQVMIETRFVTIRQSDLFALGTKIDRLAKGKRDFPDYSDAADQEDFFYGGPGHPYEGDGIRSLLGATGLGISNTTGNMRLGGVLDKFMYDLTLGVLDQMDSVKTLSAPRVTVINNHEAKIRRGSTKYYFDEFEA
ncbi:MAG: hypothetical protein D6820_14895, partial [Lentisphaerae bacterium]